MLKISHILALQLAKLHQAGALLLSPGSILSLPQTALGLAIGGVFLALRQRRRRRRRLSLVAVLRALKASRHILCHPSTHADLLYYAVNTFAVGTLIGWGMFSAGAVSALMVHTLNLQFGQRAPSGLPIWLLRGGITFTAFLGYELGYYLDHRLKHRIPFLWEFHKVHHAAEVLTPITVFRVHPVDTLIFVDITAAAAGALHGLFEYMSGQPLSIYFLGGTNAILLPCLLLLAQLQHSQFWIPLRGLPGRLILSPAHHQLHHSADPAHHHCNFGSFMGLFDWVFGTLNIPEIASPRLTFGVDQSTAKPHSISALLIDPVLNASRTLYPAQKRAEVLTARTNP